MVLEKPAKLPDVPNQSGIALQSVDVDEVVARLAELRWCSRLVSVPTSPVSSTPESATPRSVTKS
jgi:hypothetical protein